jgi:translation elongation factor EF-Tu-like GTPase
MADIQVWVRAEIRLLSPAEGGRDAPIKGSFRPNHNFSGPDNSDMAVGLVTIPDQVLLSPGERAEATVTFLTSAELARQIRPGKRWRIQEGRKLIGEGTILEVLPAAGE